MVPRQAVAQGSPTGQEATLTLDNDTVSEDTSSINPGGGVYFYYRTDTDTLTLDNDTFSGDRATQGGGVDLGCVAPCATATLDNDTFWDDTAENGGSAPGGAILADGPNATLDDDTFLDDTSFGTTGDAGIYSANGTVTISNSILDNSACGGNQPTDGGYNVESDDTCGLSSSDSPPSVVNSTTIGLAAAPAANGSSGPETLAIGPGSSALEEVPTTPTSYCTLATDERGLSRPGVSGQECDAGAYEFQGVVPSITSADSTTFTVGTEGSFTVTTNGYPDPAISALDAPVDAHLRRQPQRHGDPVRHAGERDAGQLPVHHHGKQWGRPQRQSELHLGCLGPRLCL